MYRLEHQTRQAAGAGEFFLGSNVRPDGTTIGVDGTSLLRNGRRWLATMGEIHFSRVARRRWRESLLKMRAGGIGIVASYVFWIHHEEIEGEFDWTGDRDLRGFAQVCHELSMPLVVRLGPWCHGEVRNGGLPDWIVAADFKPRSNAPGYLAAAERLYRQIAGQLDGLLWKDGGPVVGAQIENEYGGPGEHLLELQRLAIDAGIDVPLYTRTGWPTPSTPVPFGKMLPLYGAYAEGFWARELEPMPGEYWRAFTFEKVRTDVEVGADMLGKRAVADDDDAPQYPYLTCEIGGGMEQSYHRRILLDPMDVLSVVMCKLGSGSNLPGYYMYHGGVNPRGKRTTLQESQATRYWNDSPTRSYDFQAPLGSYGQVREPYHLLRRLHAMLQDFGEWLAPMTPAIPAALPAGKTDTATLRHALRSDGVGGFVFVNNYQRLQPMPAKPGVQFAIDLPAGRVTLPTAPMTVPADSTFALPFNLPLGPATLRHATAQPIGRLFDGEAETVVFFEVPGLASEFVFDAAGVTVEHASGSVGVEAGVVRIGDVRPSRDRAIRLRAADGRRLDVLLLDDATSRSLWKVRLGGRERLVLCDATVMEDGEGLQVETDREGEVVLEVFPPPVSLEAGGRRIASREAGVFGRFVVPVDRPALPQVTVEQVQEAGPLRAIAMGHAKVAEAPGDGDFASAAAWSIRFDEPVEAGRDLLLRIEYVGDVARVRHGGTLLDDSFYSGRCFDVGVSGMAKGEAFELQILPLQRGAPIHLHPRAAPEFAGRAAVVTLESVELLERTRVGVRC